MSDAKEMVAELRAAGLNLELGHELGVAAIADLIHRAADCLEDQESLLGHLEADRDCEPGIFPVIAGALSASVMWALGLGVWRWFS
jgi:hypothetical protein